MQIAVSAWNVLSYWDQFADIWIVFLDGKILYQHRAALVLIGPRIRRGETLSKALQKLSVIPPVARQLIQAGEASVRIAGMTERSAILVENGLSTERKRIAALLEPILMMVVGAFVLTIVLAVLLPIFDLQSVVAG